MEESERSVLCSEVRLRGSYTVSRPHPFSFIWSILIIYRDRKYRTKWHYAAPSVHWEEERPSAWKPRGSAVRGPAGRAATSPWGTTTWGTKVQ